MSETVLNMSCMLEIISPYQEFGNSEKKNVVMLALVEGRSTLFVSFVCGYSLSHFLSCNLCHGMRMRCSVLKSNLNHNYLKLTAMATQLYSEVHAIPLSHKISSDLKVL